MAEKSNKLPFVVLYEDNHLIAVSKRSGVLVQGDRTNDKCLIDHVKDYIKEKYNKPGEVFLGSPHRLDRPVSGLVIFCRTSKALERMNALFRNKDIIKTYWAVVKRRPREKEDKLTHFLQKDPSRNVTTAFEEPTGDAKKSELHYKVLGVLNEHYLLEVKPITGRPHQIRVQLASIGSPIRGDIKYGFKKPNPDKSINLHARKLEFIHPVKKEPVLIIAPLPENEFWEQFLVFDNKLSDRDLNKIL